MKTLIIVESPSKAHKIQSFLDDSYIVIASKGHIVDLAKGGKHGMGIDLTNNFKPHYVILDDKVNTLQSIMNAAKQCEKIILMPDQDREGEAIGYHLATRLEQMNKPISRAETSEITKNAVLEALKNTREINMSLVRAQEGRRILDRIVGFSASPFLMQYFGPNLSAGRVQSVITKMVVEREQEIENFIPEEYFIIQARLSNDIQSFTAKYEGKINNKNTANKIKLELEDKLAEYFVSNVEATEEKKKPYPPIITARLQQIMSKQFKISATRTMAAAQNLYEQGIITYHRTDSVRVSDEALKSVRSWLKENNFDIPKIANNFKNKETSQAAHEAIRPTDISNSGEMLNLIGDEKDVYDVIWKYFVASQMKPAIYNTLKVSIKIKNNINHTLIASGKALKYKGFLEIFGTNDSSLIDIPNLNKNDRLSLIGDKAITVERKQTQPPSRYSEASLIEILEKKAIGRPSTYATLLSTITTRNYVLQNNNIFYPTELGKNITNELIKWFSFLEYDYTAKLEMELDKIADGELDYIKMLTDFYSTFKEELKKAYISKGSTPCNKCDGMMRELTNKKGERFLACNRYPNCKNTTNIQKVKNVA